MNELEWNWFEEVEDDLWWQHLDSAPVGPNLGGWKWDSGIVRFDSTRYTLDGGTVSDPVTQMDAAFDVHAFDDGSDATDDAWIAQAGDLLSADVAANPALNVDDDFAWSEFDDSDPADETSTIASASEFLLIDAPPNGALSVEDVWNFDDGDGEDAASDIILTSDSASISAGLNAAQIPEDAFDWSQDADDDSVNGLESSDPVGLDAQTIYDEAWDWTDTEGEADFDGASELPVDDGSAVLVEDPWDWTQDDGENDVDDVAGLPVQADNVNLALSVEDAFHYAFDESDAADDTSDVVAGSAYALINVPDAIQYFDAWDWNQEEADSDALQLICDEDDDEVGPDFPTAGLAFDDAWDWGEEPDSDSDLADFALVDLPITAIQYFEDASDPWSQDADDESFAALDTDGVVADVIAPPVFEEVWDWNQDEADEPWQVILDDDDDAISPTVDAAFDDAWDWGEEPDSDSDLADFALVDLPITAIQYFEDASDPWSQDADDESFAALDTDGVVADVIAPPVFEEIWDWNQDEADEPWQVILDDDDDAVSPDAPSPTPIADEWPFDQDEADQDIDIALDAFSIDSIAVAPYQFTDDAFDWTDYLDVEDQVDEYGFYVSAIPFIRGGPRFIARRKKRLFTIARSPRRFSVARPRSRKFTVSAITQLRFDALEPSSEAYPLTFDFTPDLNAGETLVSVMSVSISVVYGADPTPTNIFNGAAMISASATTVIVPVKNAVVNTDYQIIVTVSTSNVLKNPVLVGVLPVRL